MKVTIPYDDFVALISAVCLAAGYIGGGKNPTKSQVIISSQCKAASTNAVLHYEILDYAL